MIVKTHRLTPLTSFTLACLVPLVLALGVVPAAAQPPTVLPQIERPAAITRDVDGLPHVNAQNEHDLFFLQGWIHAQDRLFQMDLNRRQPSGTLAELLGPPALSSDVELRTLGLRRAAEATLPVLSERTRDALQAYADGVNAWVARHPLPLEYLGLEITTFEPWTPVDSVVIGKVIAFGLSFDLDIGLTETLLTYQAAGQVAGFDGAALFFEDLFRSAPFDPASTLPDAGVAPPALFPPAVVPPTDKGASTSSPTPSLRSLTESARLALRRLDPATVKMASRYLDRVKDLPLLRSATDPRERIEGSNEFAIAGRHTANGRAILANDPHLALDAPSTFYQIHLRAPQVRLDVIGSGFPGVPFVILGQTPQVAWGATTNPLDVTDTFQEQLVIDPNLGPVAIVHGGTPEPLMPIPVIFRYNQIGDLVPDNLAVAPPGGDVNGTFIPPVVLLVPRRNNGPLIAFDAQAGVGLSVQYTGFGATREIEAFRVWNRARDLDDFVFGLQLFDVGSQNFAYADVDGNIAYFTSAEMPIREDLQAGTVNGLPPFLIRDGTGGNDWLPVQNPQPEQSLPFEILPFDEMPKAINPPAGYFVNANNDPAGTTLDNNALNQLRTGGSGVYYLNPGYASGFRAGRITQALQAKIAAGPVTPADLQDVQAEVRLLDAEVLTPHLIAAYDHATDFSQQDAQLVALAQDPRVIEAIGRLRSWDFSFPTGIPEGFDHTDVVGHLSLPSDEEVAASIAATIYAVWRGQAIRRTIDAALNPFGLPGPGSAQAMTALRHLLDTFPQSQGIGASGLDFFPAPGALSRETARDIALLGALTDALDLLAGPDFDDAFGGSADQNDYRWGRLHRIVLESPLGPPFSIPPAGGVVPPPLTGLDGIPVDGGFGAVDASSHSARADGSDDFMFGSGPVRRYVGQPGDGQPGGPGEFFTAETSLPGGMSGVLTSPFYANLLPRWLTNDTYPLRQAFPDYLPTVVERMRFVPAP